MKKAWGAAALTFFGSFGLVTLLKVIWEHFEGGDPMVLFTNPGHLLFLTAVFAAAAFSSYSRVRRKEAQKQASRQKP